MAVIIYDEQILELTRDYLDFGLCPSSGILKKKFRKLDLFLSSGEGVRDTLLGPLERVNLIQCLKDPQK
jgi:hypothetical protein